MKSKHANSKIITIVLLICIAIVLIIIAGNLYFIFKSSSENFSSDVNGTRIEFSSKSIICGNESDKHIRTFVREVQGDGEVVGIKFIAKNDNGKSYSYAQNSSSALLGSGGGVRRIDVVYSQLRANPSENIIQLEVVPLLKDANGKQVFGKSSKSPDVCYSSCNDCSVSCNLICTNYLSLP